MAKTSHARRPVHRSLHLASTPPMSGPDVKALQDALEATMKHHRIDWLPLKVDGELGPQTLHVARFLSWVIGLGNGHRSKIKQGTIPMATQRLLRDPRKRSKREKQRQERRQPKLKKIRAAQDSGPKAAVAYARDWVGITESPAGSNSGPTSTRNGKPGGITFWESYWGLGACFWCLVFASYCVRAIGKAKIPGREAAVVCVNAAEMERSARAHVNGFVAVPISEAREGDISLWCFDGSGVPDHGELVIGPFHGRSNDIGGNTSDGASGSQSNGGGVFLRPDRDLSLCTCIARPLYAG